MTSSNKSVVPGIILILLGVMFLLPTFTSLRMREMWPVFVLGSGVVFWVMFFRNRDRYGLLMPATILTLVGLLFFYSVFEGWYMMRTLWPVFILAPGLGFLLMYFFGQKETGFAVAGGVLGCIGLIFLVDAREFAYLWPLILIVVGVILLVQGRRRG